jgi:SNF2 family DNA or RNA helicase
MGFPFKNPPSEIQRNALIRASRVPAFALFHAMGAGKTFASINLAAARYLKKKVKHTIIIVNPSSIKDVWEVELEKHCPVPYDVHIYNAGGQKKCATWQNKREDDKMHCLVFGIEAFSQGNAIKVLSDYIDKYSKQGIMMIIDESTGIKNHSSTRSKKITKEGHKCDYRMILTGTPITQGYQDLFSQFKFLDPDIIGCKSYILFKNLYCITGGFENRSIIGYQRIEELTARIAPFCDIVTKEEAMPYLLPKQYLPSMMIQPSPEQKRAMESLKQQYMAEDGGDVLTVSMAMERITRYQQICGGHFPFDDVENGGYKIKPIEGPNPKLAALMAELDIIYENNEKCIIWARFVPEVELIYDNIVQKFGDKSIVHFYGGTAKEDRRENTRRFQEDPECMFIISTQAVGAKGQTWTAGTQTRYYSQTFSYEDRMQSEDRPHRRGQENSCGYRDFVMNVNADKMIAKAIAKKHDVSEEFKSGVGKIDLGAA